MMNVKKESKPFVKKEGACGCSDKKAVVKPIRQADVTMKPGMVDEPFVDTGLHLGSMDLGEPVSM